MHAPCCSNSCGVVICADCPGLCVWACLRVAVSPATGHVYLCVSVWLCVSVPPHSPAVCSWVLSPHSALASLPGPHLVSLRPGSELLSPQPHPPERPLSNFSAPASLRAPDWMDNLAPEGGQRPSSLLEEKPPHRATEHRLEEKKAWLTNGFDVFECPPPKTENEV